MSDDTRFDRREFLRASGVVATGAAVAGCTDTGGGGGDGGQQPADGGNGTGGNVTDTNQTGNDTGGNVTEGNETGGNATAENETDGNVTAENETDGNVTAENETGGNQSGNQTAGGNGSAEVLVGPNGNFVFEPEQLSIDAGTTVRWIWESDTHNVVPTSQPQGSSWQGHPDIEDTGFEYEHTFETTGTYEYVCEPHEAAGMIGSITVE